MASTLTNHVRAFIFVCKCANRKIKMAEQEGRVNVNTRENNEQNTNANVPDYSNHQAWTQYWQYYYSYYMQYYTFYYYMALCQNSAGFVGPSAMNVQPTAAQLNGARVHPDFRQRLLNGGFFGAGDLGQRNQPQERMYFINSIVNFSICTLYIVLPSFRTLPICGQNNFNSKFSAKTRKEIKND